MEIIIKVSPEEVTAEAFRILASELARKPALVIGLSTGRSPVALYRMMRESKLDFSQAWFFNLDEYLGLGAGHPQSFHTFLHGNLLDGINVPRERIRLVRGDAPDPEAECEAYEEAIRARGGIDLQLLGIGPNGHIAFNDPGSSLGSRTRIWAPEPKTFADYSKSFRAPEEAPRFVLTMGIGTILETRRALLIATGREKAEIVRQALEGPVTVDVPASALQLHPRPTVILDEAAAHSLVRRDYWKWLSGNRRRVGR